MTPEARLAEMKVATEQQISMARGWKTGNDFRAQQLIAALEAVLGLHSEYQDEPDEWTHCVCCSDPVAGIYFHYPCSTVTAITKALGVKS